MSSEDGLQWCDSCLPEWEACPACESLNIHFPPYSASKEDPYRCHDCGKRWFYEGVGMFGDVDLKVLDSLDDTVAHLHINNMAGDGTVQYPTDTEPDKGIFKMVGELLVEVYEEVVFPLLKYTLLFLKKLVLFLIGLLVKLKNIAKPYVKKSLNILLFPFHLLTVERERKRQQVRRLAQSKTPLSLITESKVPQNLITVSPWARLGACLLEGVLVMVTLGIGWLIWALTLSGKGQTPAKNLLNHAVVDIYTGQPLGLGRMFWIRGIIGGLTALVGFSISFGILALMPFWDSKNQNIWDQWSDSYVIPTPN